jgi:hypothetical protein
MNYAITMVSGGLSSSVMIDSGIEVILRLLVQQFERMYCYN